MKGASTRRSTRRANDTVAEPDRVEHAGRKLLPPRDLFMPGASPARVALLIACASWAVVLFLPQHRTAATAVLVACTTFFGAWLGDARASRCVTHFPAGLRQLPARLWLTTLHSLCVCPELYRPKLPLSTPSWPLHTSGW